MESHSVSTGYMCVGKSSERRLIDGPFLINYDWIFGGFFFTRATTIFPFASVDTAFTAWKMFIL